ncbi:hypothetical protein HanRHA438_Chr03g0143111 [Helianthus annuus]|nr:hypothetical protein HanIR_Chr03g0143231 [Helianthus annuus]KAJ0937524.1 hypothetical protein HanRHA438_Chr03g0143111 [Helianthus annuus]
MLARCEMVETCLRTMVLTSPFIPCSEKPSIHVSSSVSAALTHVSILFILYKKLGPDRTLPISTIDKWSS